MGFIGRLIAPELDRVNAELHQARANADWFEKRCEDLGGERLKALATLEKERNRHRKREEALINIILVLKTGRAIPPDVGEEEAESEISDLKSETGLSTAQESLLWSRAREYAASRPGEFSDDPDENAQKAFELMSKDPEQWLSD